MGDFISDIVTSPGIGGIMMEKKVNSFVSGSPARKTRRYFFSIAAKKPPLLFFRLKAVKAPFFLAKRC